MGSIKWASAFIFKLFFPKSCESRDQISLMFVSRETIKEKLNLQGRKNIKTIKVVIYLFFNISNLFYFLGFESYDKELCIQKVLVTVIIMFL